MPILKRVLLAYSEYERLLECERLLHQLQKERKGSDQPKLSETGNLEGAGEGPFSGSERANVSLPANINPTPDPPRESPVYVTPKLHQDNQLVRETLHLEKHGHLKPESIGNDNRAIPATVPDKATNEVSTKSAGPSDAKQAKTYPWYYIGHNEYSSDSDY